MSTWFNLLLIKSLLHLKKPLSLYIYLTRDVLKYTYLDFLKSGQGLNSSSSAEALALSSTHDKLLLLLTLVC